MRRLAPIRWRSKQVKDAGSEACEAGEGPRTPRCAAWLHTREKQAGQGRRERSLLRRRATEDAEMRRLSLVCFEVLLAGAANRTEPVIRDLVEGGSRGDAPVRVSLLGVVDE